MKIHILNMRTNPFEGFYGEFKVDRCTPVGNPFIMNGEGSREHVCNEYDNWFKVQTIKKNKAFIAYLSQIQRELALGSDIFLFCWCAPRRCHAETIRDWLLEQIKGEDNG